MDSSCDDVCKSDLELRELKVQVKDLLKKIQLLQFELQATKEEVKELKKQTTEVVESKRQTPMQLRTPTVPEDHESWSQPATKLLEMNEQLVKFIAEHLRETPISGSTCNWKCYAEKMKIPCDNLHAMEESERLYNITYECQKQSTTDITVKELYIILKEIQAHYAAEGLLTESFFLCEQRKRTSSDARDYRKPEFTFPVQCMQHRNTMPHGAQRPTLNPRNKD